MSAYINNNINIINIINYINSYRLPYSKYLYMHVYREFQITWKTLVADVFIAISNRRIQCLGDQLI